MFSRLHHVGYNILLPLFQNFGGRDDNGINAIISGSKYSKTMLGEISGEITPRVQKIATALEKSGMKPFISNRIMTWLIPHYAFVAGFSTGIIKAGGTMETFLKNTKIVKETIMAVRDGFHVCSQMGIDPKKEKVNRLYYMPLFLSVPIVKKVFSDVAMQAMFDGYLKNSTNEAKKMIEVVKRPRISRINTNCFVLIVRRISKYKFFNSC